MSRAGYDEDINSWQFIRWRGQVASSIRGARGQAFLRELVTALDEMPNKSLVAESLQDGDNVCALGSVGVRRGLDMSKIDTSDADVIAFKFGIAEQLVREIEFMNDEAVWNESPERRWTRMRKWATDQIR